MKALKAPGEEALRLYSLLAQHGQITADGFAENLVAALLGGTLMARGNKGFDLDCPGLGRVEVRARVIGTDGDAPRVTIRADPPWKFTHLAVVRLTPTFALDSVWLLPATGVEPLYLQFRQKKSLAHIPWHQACSISGARNVTTRALEFVALASK